MKVTLKNVKKFQDGGQMAPEDPTMGAPAEAEGAPASTQDPLMALAEMAAQALQSQDCNAAMQTLQAFIQLVRQASGGAPAPEEPVYQRRGGRLVRK